MFEKIHHRTDIPQRTDQGKVLPYRTHKRELFGTQQGSCAGCRREFSFRDFEVDHKVPRTKGGTDHFANLQLLCSFCNRTKGTRSHPELLARLHELGMLAA